MKHILIISYAFYPLNFVSAWRQYYRLKYFKKLGYEVTVITRFWKKGNTQRDNLYSPDNNIREEEILGGKILRFPFGINNLQELNIFQKLIRKGLKWPFFKYFFKQLAYFFLPIDYHIRLSVDIKALDKSLIKKPDIVIASGDPWHTFEIGKEIAEAYKAKFVCEYRDPWNYIDESCKVEGFNSFNDNIWSQFKRKISIQREKKSAGSADGIVSVSDLWTRNAANITGVKNYGTIRNGFEPEEFEAVNVSKNDKFTITYVGTLHAPPQQKLDIFMDGLKFFFKEKPEAIKKLSLQFVGTSDSYNFEKTKGLIDAYPFAKQIVIYIPRVPKKESIAYQKASHLLLFIAHSKLKGQYPVKIFEYIGSGVPIILTPKDDVCAELLKETNTGVVSNDSYELKNYLCQFYEEWKENNKIKMDRYEKKVNAYTNELETHKYAEFIEMIDKNE